jgi:transglutaminase-like putative cysteine protease
MVDERYIVVAWGRDYADVPPLRGIIFIESDSSAIDVEVDVAPIPAPDLSGRSTRRPDTAAPTH